MDFWPNECRGSALDEKTHCRPLYGLTNSCLILSGYDWAGWETEIQRRQAADSAEVSGESL